MAPAVIEAMARFRAAIESQQQAESLRMARAWLDISRGLDQEFERLAREAAPAAAGGRSMSLWHVQRMERYQALLAQILEQQRKFATVAAGEVTQTQALLGRWGLAHSSSLITIQRPAVSLHFDRLPVQAVENMVGNAGDGTPLGNLLRRSFGDEGIQVGKTLVCGTGLGWHPERIARAMREVVNVTLDKAIVIGRTEELRVYREASRQQYIESGIVEGYRRVAARSTRTCLACLMADGVFYLLSEPFDEHPNGRCTSIPVVRGAPQVVYESGEQWFMRQDEATQRGMMGPGRYEAWQEGRFRLQDLISVRHSHDWGYSLQVTPLHVLAARPAGSVPRPRGSSTVVSVAPPAPTQALRYQSSPQQKAVVDQYVMSEIEQYALSNGLVVNDVRDAVMAAMREVVENVPVSINFRHGDFGGLQKTMRFMSQFETGTSGGMFDPAVRAEAELKGLGYPLKVAPTERPIYGHYNITGQPPRAAAGYGRLEFVLKPEMRQRATFTIGDSLARFGYDHQYGAAVLAPELGAADSNISAIMQYVMDRDKDRLVRKIAYVEAQVQGGVQLSDVEYVIDHSLQLSAAERSWLQAMGIGVR